MSRRRFLTAGTSLGLSIAAWRSPPVFGGSTGKRLIDVHCHIAPPSWLDAMDVIGRKDPFQASWSVQKLLEDMDAADISTAITSPTTPQVSLLGKAVAVRLARESNEFARKMTADHPGRFGMFAMLPLPHVDESLREIAYAFDTLQADGVGILTSYNQLWLGDPAFSPLWEELNRRKAVVYVHPTVPNCCGSLVKQVPDFVVEVAADTARSIASVILSGTSRRYPGIRWIWSHGGGSLVAVAERLLVQAVQLPPPNVEITREIVAGELNRFFYDTAQITGSVTLTALSKLVPISQIVFGTDSPFRSSAEHTRGLAASFKGDDLKMIERENALRLLPHLQRQR